MRIICRYAKKEFLNPRTTPVFVLWGGDNRIAEEIHHQADGGSTNIATHYNTFFSIILIYVKAFITGA